MNQYADTVKRSLAKQRLWKELEQLMDGLHRILLFCINQVPTTRVSEEFRTSWLIYSLGLVKEADRVRNGLMISRKSFHMTWTDRQTNWIRENADKVPMYHELLMALEMVGLPAAAYSRICHLAGDKNPDYPAADFSHESLDGLLERFSVVYGDDECQIELAEVIRIAKEGLTAGVIRPFTRHTETVSSKE